VKVKVKVKAWDRAARARASDAWAAIAGSRAGGEALAWHRTARHRTAPHRSGHAARTRREPVPRRARRSASSTSAVASRRRVSVAPPLEPAAHVGAGAGGRRDLREARRQLSFSKGVRAVLRACEARTVEQLSTVTTTSSSSQPRRQN